MKKFLYFAAVLLILCAAAGLSAGAPGASASNDAALSEVYFSGTEFEVGPWLNSKPNGTFDMTFHTAAAFQSITFMSYAGRSENQQQATVHYKLYQWFYNREATLSNEPVETGTFTADGDGFITVQFAEQDPGQYIFVLEYPQQQPGAQSYFVVGTAKQPAENISVSCWNNITEQGDELICGYIGFIPAADNVYYRALSADTEIPADVPVKQQVPFSSETNLSAAKVGWWMALKEKKGVFCMAFHSLYDFTGIEFYSYGGEQEHIVQYALYPWPDAEPVEIAADGTAAIAQTPVYQGSAAYTSNGLRTVSFGKSVEKGQYLFVITYDPAAQTSASDNHFVIGVAEADPELPLQIDSNGVVDHETYGQTIVQNGFCGSLIAAAPAGTDVFFAPLVRGNVPDTQPDTPPHTETGDMSSCLLLACCLLLPFCLNMVRRKDPI